MNNGGFHLNLYENTYSFIIFPLVFDHHIRELVNKLTDIQHDYQECILSTQHIHLDHNNCLEIIAAKGDPGKVVALADTLKAVKGIKHGQLSMSSTGKDIR